MADNHLGSADVLEGARHRVQVTHAVIDYGNPLGHGLQNPFGRRAGAGHGSVGCDRHAQRSAKRLEYGFGLVVRIVSAEIIDVQRHVGVIHEALKELDHQINIELTHFGTSKRHMKFEPRTTATVDHYARQRLIQRHVGVPVTHDAFLVSNRFAKRLPKGDADVFHRVMRIDVQVSLGGDIEVHLAVSGDLIQHMLEEG